MANPCKLNYATVNEQQGQIEGIHSVLLPN